MACLECRSKCTHYYLTKIDYNQVSDLDKSSCLKARVEILLFKQPSCSEAPVDRTAKRAAYSKKNAGNSVAKVISLPLPVARPLDDDSVYYKEETWVVVRFQLEETEGECKWIGRIIRVNEKDRYLVTFVPVSYTHLTLPTIYSV